MTATESVRIGLAPVVDAALHGNEQAWREIVDRFERLVWATARSCGLNEADAADVTQTTWLRLAEQLGRISAPEALPGWLVTTTRREAARVAKRSRRPLPAQLMANVDLTADPPPADVVVAAERRSEVRAAFEHLGERCRILLALLSADAPMSYEEISAQVDMPVGSIGPTRRRCLGKLARLLDHRQEVRR
jgi:RNA polymerase sigma factor (sigma-70 family)